MSRTTSTHRSAVLILALLLMGAISASTIALSTVMVENGHQTQTLNNFISASLASDSGLERGLAVVKLGRSSQTLNAAISKYSTLGWNTSTSPSLSGVTLSADQGNSSDEFDLPKLRAHESITFDILKYSGGTLTQPETDTLVVHANKALGSTAALDISWIGLNATGTPFFSGRYFFPNDAINGPTALKPGDVGYTTLSVPLYVNVNSVDLNNPSNPVTNQTLSDLSQTRGFRMHIMAVNDTVNNIQITGAKSLGGGVSGGFPSRININSLGSVSGSSSQKSASVLWQLPASQVFNYVLFTEGNIIPQ